MKWLREMFVWGFGGVVLVVCGPVLVSWVLFSVGVCVCGCDLLIFLTGGSAVLSMPPRRSDPGALYGSLRYSPYDFVCVCVCVCVCVYLISYNSHHKSFFFAGGSAVPSTPPRRSDPVALHAAGLPSRTSVG